MTLISLTLLLGSNVISVFAAEEDNSPDDIILPETEISEINIPTISIDDFEIGVFTGFYSTEDFGTDGVVGILGSYHLTEDIFLNLTIGSGRVSDATGSANLFDDGLLYYNFLVGYNILPGEVYSGKGKAWSSSTYFVGGVGVTELNGKSNATIVIGGGLRFVPASSFAIHIDFRDNILNSDLRGANKTIQNIELTAGASWFF